jgi:hypothetical protein
MDNNTVFPPCGVFFASIPPHLENSAMIIETGKIIAFRLFNLGETIDLRRAAKILEAHHHQSAINRAPKRRSMLIVEHPLSYIFESFRQEIRGKTYLITPQVKIWSFGTLSLQYVLPIETSHTITELNHLGNFLETSEDFSARAVKLAQAILQLLADTIEEPELWGHWEDYLIFSIKKAELPTTDLKSAFLTNEVASMILTEEPMEFAPKVVARLEQYIHQYGTNDLVLLHWNGALIYDPGDEAHHLQETIEYALCQLLELRYYDFFLDTQLKFLYQKIENNKQTVFSNFYGELSRQAALEYIDISEIVDQVENAFKVTGDFYYASIFKSVARELQIPEWRKNVSGKLSNLAEISKIFQGEINERRNQILEIIIIILIMVEVASIFKNFFL